MTGVHTEAEQVEPIVIYRSVNRDGETYALESRSQERLKQVFGPRAHFRSRVFIAHETKADYNNVHGEIAPQVVLLLTGIPEEKLRPLGGVTFRDPVTEQDLPRLEQ